MTRKRFAKLLMQFDNIDKNKALVEADKAIGLHSNYQNAWNKNQVKYYIEHAYYKACKSTKEVGTSLIKLSSAAEKAGKSFCETVNLINKMLQNESPMENE